MIFYFTATGNGKFIAEGIADKTHDELFDIAACVKANRFDFSVRDGEAFGLVIPVYFYGIPIIVSDFLEKLSVRYDGEPYSYLALHCGTTTANAERFVTKRLPMNAIFGMKAVENYVPMYRMAAQNDIESQLDKLEQEIASAAEHIQKRASVRINDPSDALSRLITPIVYLTFQRGRKTAKFTVNDDCIGCGLCEKICPRQAIELLDKKPVWIQPQCETCLACLHRCPAAAINYGKKTARNGRYQNRRTQLPQ